MPEPPDFEGRRGKMNDAVMQSQISEFQFREKLSNGSISEGFRASLRIRDTGDPCGTKREQVLNFQSIVDPEVRTSQRTNRRHWQRLMRVILGSSADISNSFDFRDPTRNGAPLKRNQYFDVASVPQKHLIAVDDCYPQNMFSQSETSNNIGLLQDLLQT